MPVGEKLERKNAYRQKLITLLETKPQALMCLVDNVGSKQLQNIRNALRGKCIVLMGKNTMIRAALRARIEETQDEGLERLLSHVNGNFGFIFCEEGTMEDARKVLDDNKLPAPAKAGTVAPCDVWVHTGPSGLDPAATSFFQALNIPTKIVKGMVEITSDVKLVTKNEKVSLSAQALLTKLGVKPFEYGMVVRSVYQEGSVFDAAVLDITDDVLTQKFMNGVNNVAAFGREIGIPTEAGLPHMISNAFKNIIGLVADTDFDAGEKVTEIKTLLNDPEALAKMKQAAASAPAAGGAAAGGGAAPAAAEAAPEEEEEEMEFDLFD